MFLGEFLIVFLFASTFACSSSDELSATDVSHFRKISKNAFVDVKIKNRRVVINTSKNDGSELQIEMRIEDEVLQKLPLKMIECDQFSICISSGDVNHTVIDILPTNEYINVRRNITEGRLIDCVSLKENTQWIGGPEHRYQHWPIQHMYFDEEPYVPTHPTDMAITERYWLSSHGAFIHATQSSPLFIDQNNYKENYLCLIVQNKKPYVVTDAIKNSYTIGLFEDSRKAHEFAVENYLGKPLGHPDETMIKHPVWSTWARYKANVSDTVVNEFVDEIIDNKFNNSQIEIDDNWETCYGSAVFDTKKFPNITKLTEDLKKKNFRVTLWIHPFINENCEAYSTALNNNYFVKNTDGSVHTTWWQGANGAGAIDFTNDKAVEWWVDRLKVLESLGIDSFKFDAGEISFLPQTPVVSGLQSLQPGIFTTSYVNALANNFNDIIEVRVGWASQYLPIFVRMIDKDTRYNWNNGLPTLITTLLQMNIAGYVNVLPDMIGGNGYLDGSLEKTYLPDKDLFIRWLQANVFMPALQYSFVPWDYDNETIQICKTYTDLHAEITPLIIEAMQLAVETGAPVNPPIWWVDPTDQQAHKINDEFLLGEKVLIAPVIESNSVERDIYLPKGIWMDANTNENITGPVWLKDYSAPLNILPYFYKQ
ncbi:hypothetical protein HCN44_008166 [Aphidius gifuensis]|uniref:Uncharacterized protein n=1 Tax=Aphidius gifuensis TaxID=684658 RepID=A0A835CMP2_APHGI|nr:myogenesis-regulating glycosidase-like [Aphidius gifuensis]KAF7989492.1 hypothetical protein HCN44_008166 [Aphidius gifuensis]